MKPKNLGKGQITPQMFSKLGHLNIKKLLHKIRNFQSRMHRYAKESQKGDARAHQVQMVFPQFCLNKSQNTGLPFSDQFLKKFCSPQQSHHPGGEQSSPQSSKKEAGMTQEAIVS